MRGDESIASVEGTLSRRKRDRDLDSVQASSERRHLHDYLERKAESAVRAQNRLSEAEADMEIESWEQISSEMAPYETHRELESQRLQLFHANQWADQTQTEREKREREEREREEREERKRKAQVRERERFGRFIVGLPLSSFPQTLCVASLSRCRFQPACRAGTDRCADGTVLEHAHSATPTSQRLLYNATACVRCRPKYRSCGVHSAVWRPDGCPFFSFAAVWKRLRRHVGWS